VKRRILVFEDTEDSRQIIRDLLMSAGYELIESAGRSGGDGAEPTPGFDPDGHPAAGHGRL
jgi:CheY-like chemotaxis protein